MDEQRRLELQHFVDGLNEAEFEVFYRQLGDRYRLLRRAEELRAMNQFRLMDRVFFHHNREHISGTVVRINQRTLSILTDTARRWTVAPEFLAHETTSSPSASPVDRIFVQNTASGHGNPRGKSHKNQKIRKNATARPGLVKCGYGKNG